MTFAAVEKIFDYNNIPSLLLLRHKYFNIWKFPIKGGIAGSLFPDKSRFLRTLVSFSIPGGNYKTNNILTLINSGDKISRTRKAGTDESMRPGSTSPQSRHWKEIYFHRANKHDLLIRCTQTCKADSRNLVVYTATN